MHSGFVVERHPGFELGPDLGRLATELGECPSDGPSHLGQLLGAEDDEGDDPYEEDL